MTIARPSRRFANLAYACHLVLSGICLAFALAGLLIAAFPSQEMLLALMGRWFAPVAALACLGAVVGTIVAWREWRVVVATLLVAVSVPLAAGYVVTKLLDRGD